MTEQEAKDFITHLTYEEKLRLNEFLEAMLSTTNKNTMEV